MIPALDANQLAIGIVEVEVPCELFRARLAGIPAISPSAAPRPARASRSPAPATCCGADMRFIQALLGHASLTTERYTQVAITRLQEVRARTRPAARMSAMPTPPAAPAPSKAAADTGPRLTHGWLTPRTRGTHGMGCRYGPMHHW
jgi:hypothetical protein